MSDDKPEDLEQDIATRPEYEWLRSPTLWFTTFDVAKGLGFSPNTIRKQLRSYGILSFTCYGLIARSCHPVSPSCPERGVV